MIFNFLATYFNIIMLSIWAIFFALVVARAFRLNAVKNISYQCLVIGALAIHLLYGIFATALQYIAFGSSEIGKVLTTIALPKEVPFPAFLEWMRPVFDGAHGYFAFYVFQHFFLSTIVLFFITALFVGFFKFYKKQRPALFKEGDISLIALAFLISGYLGSIILAPLALVFASVVTIFRTMKKDMTPVDLSLVFLFMAPVAFIFAVPLLAIFGLYPLLKL